MPVRTLEPLAKAPVVTCKTLTFTFKSPLATPTPLATLAGGIGFGLNETLATTLDLRLSLDLRLAGGIGFGLDETLATTLDLRLAGGIGFGLNQCYTGAATKATYRTPQLCANPAIPTTEAAVAPAIPDPSAPAFVLAHAMPVRTLEPLANDPVPTPTLATTKAT